MTDTGASLVARLEARQQEWRMIAKSQAEERLTGVEGFFVNGHNKGLRECADALDLILADLRRLQSRENKEEEAARVDRVPEGERRDLPQSGNEVIPTDESRSPDGDGREAGEASQPEGTLSAGRVDPSTNTQRGNTAGESRHPGNRRNAAVNRTASEGAEIDGPAAGSEPADSPTTIQELESRLAHEADAVIALVHQQQIHEQKIAELERRVSTLSGLVNR